MMKIEVKKLPIIEACELEVGQVFKYKNEYYMVTNAFRDGWVLIKNRVYINLKNGFEKRLNHELVEVVEDIKFVVGH